MKTISSLIQELRQEQRIKAGKRAPRHHVKKAKFYKIKDQSKQRAA